MRTRLTVVAALVALASTIALGKQQGGASRLTTDVFKGLAFRSLGPSLTTGRIADFEVDPQRPNVYYVVTAAGGVW